VASIILLYTVKLLPQEQQQFLKLGEAIAKYVRGEVNNYPQCSCICVSVGSTVVLRSIAMRGFLFIISAQV
jgi:hypothetical protein